jgi:hypothetical protein
MWRTHHSSVFEQRDGAPPPPDKGTIGFYIFSVEENKLCDDLQIWNFPEFQVTNWQLLNADRFHQKFFCPLESWTARSIGQSIYPLFYFVIGTSHALVILAEFLLRPDWKLHSFSELVICLTLLQKLPSTAWTVLHLKVFVFTQVYLGL